MYTRQELRLHWERNQDEHACGTHRQQRGYQTPDSLAQEICSNSCSQLRQHWQRAHSLAEAANRVCQDLPV